jgi:hypothetical protein
MVNHALFTSNTVRSLRSLGWRAPHIALHCMAWNILQLRLPILEIIFCIAEDLTGLVRMLIWGTHITRDNGCIIEEIEETTTVAGEDDLLFGTLDSCSEFSSIGFLNLLAGL